MNWEDLLGHQQQYEWFKTALRNGRLATSFLFVGPDGIGKRAFALLLAKSLLCRKTQPQELVPCGGCEDCAQVDARTHPDLIQVAKPEEKAYLPIELLIGERDKRMREGLCHDISLRPFSGRRKVAIVDDADALNVEGANSLLKTLEEPPIDSLLILLGTSLQRQLPTIRSRCQSIIFKPLESKQLEELILREQLVDTHAMAEEIARQSSGSLTEARLLADPELIEFRQSLLQSLAQRTLPMADIAKRCIAMADAAGKESRLRRDRMRLIMRMAAELYRSIAYRLSAQNTATEGQSRENVLGSDQATQQSTESAMRHWTGGTRAATECWNRCLLAIEQVDRNANQTALLEAWASDLARLSRC